MLIKNILFLFTSFSFVNYISFAQETAPLQLDGPAPAADFTEAPLDNAPVKTTKLKSKQKVKKNKVKKNKVKKKSKKKKR